MTDGFSRQEVTDVIVTQKGGNGYDAGFYLMQPITQRGGAACDDLLSEIDEETDYWKCEPEHWAAVKERLIEKGIGMDCHGNDGRIDHLGATPSGVSLEQVDA